jgi:hypothetical protein
MRRSYCTVNGAEVRAAANKLLCASLGLKPGPAGLSVTRIVHLLLAAASWTCSLLAIGRRLAGFPSRESLRKAIRDAIPKDLRELEQRINDGLQTHWPNKPGRGSRGHLVAIDLHQRPYYGDRATPGILNGGAKQGTKYFWTYATLVVLTPQRRYTLAVTAVDNNRLAATVERLWEYVAPLNLNVRCVLLDRGFYAGPVIRWLQEHKYPFVMPAVKRGSLGNGTKGPTGTARFFAMTKGGTFEHSWKERGKGPEVRVSVTVTRVLAGGRRGADRKWHRKTLVYVHSVETPGQSGRWFVRTYKRRFGIETSYRQLGEGLASTCTTDRRRRLLLVGVALLLRNVWVWLQVLQRTLLGVRRYHLIPLSDIRITLSCEIAAFCKADNDRDQLSNNSLVNKGLR